MLTLPTDEDYLPMPTASGLEAINNAPLGQPQGQLYGAQNLGNDLRSILLQRLRESFTGSYGA